MLAHDQHLGARVLQRFVVEPERSAIEPTGPGLLVVVEAEPDVGKLPDLGVVLTPPQIDDVGYPEGPEFLDVPPGRYGATKCQSLGDEKRFQPCRLSSSVRSDLDV